MFRSLRQSLLACAMIFTLSALAADTNIDVAKSTLSATFKQEGVPVTAPFRRFSGRVVYNAANVEATTAALDVETGSLDIGDESYNAEVRKKDWFDSVGFPKATFRSTTVKLGTGGQLNATGALTIKGRVQTLTVPITVKVTGKITSFDGSLAISRKAFGIGDPSWSDVLEDQVTVRFHLVNSAP